MRKPILILLYMMALTSCSGWFLYPSVGPTPFMPPTGTPSIYTATPFGNGVNSSTPLVSIITPTETLSPTLTDTPQATETSVAETPTVSPSGSSIQIIVLGCNTSIDITHGMGEVTNAFVTLKNIGGMDLTNLKATLYALDEGRVHPDKTTELTSLPVGYQVTIKLTVDSTYKKDSPIQVNVSSDQGGFPRAGLASCTDLGVLSPDPDSLKTPVPNTP